MQGQHHNSTFLKSWSDSEVLPSGSRSTNFAPDENGNTAASVPKHESYADYNERIATYLHWPSNIQQTPISMAGNGFFYTGSKSLVRCFQCGLGLQHWLPEDDPALQHIKYSPNCQYLVRRLDVESLNRYRTELALEGIIRNENGCGSEKVELLPTFPNARHPLYAVYNVRLSSFSKWPTGHPQNPRTLAEAGFFYSGVQDIVRCFVCDGGLRMFAADDDPMVEHAKWFPNCQFVLKTKGDEFVLLVQRAVDNLNQNEATSSLKPSKLDNELRVNATVTKSSDEDHLDITKTAAAQSVIDFGYSKAAVRMAINELQTKGTTNVTSEQIMKTLLDKEEMGDVEAQRSTDEAAEFIAKENRKLKEQVFCSQCHLHEKNMLFLPCSHLELCQVCATNASLCPRCREDVKQKVKTYMS